VLEQFFEVVADGVAVCAGAASRNNSAFTIRATNTSAAIPSARAKPVRTTISAATAVPMKANRSLRMCW
jgi:hypothetical protein